MFSQNHCIKPGEKIRFCHRDQAMSPIEVTNEYMFDQCSTSDWLNSRYEGRKNTICRDWQGAKDDHDGQYLYFIASNRKLCEEGLKMKIMVSSKCQSDHMYRPVVDPEGDTYFNLRTRLKAK